MRSNASYRVNARRKSALIRRTNNLTIWKGMLQKNPKSEICQKKVSIAETDIANLIRNIG